MVSLLESITGPGDLRGLSSSDLAELADEIRHFLISHVSRTGGHLGPNLGVVELTIALHLVFDSPHDPIIFDTGHQSYVHKILTGRQAGFQHLREKGGLSGYPSRAESEHDWVEDSHASTSLSWAEGLARGFRLTGADDRHVVAVIGDGALTGGMAWEALNNIAVDDDLPLVIVVNDNGRSYAPTIGGLSRHLTGIRTDPRYEQTLDQVKTSIKKAPMGDRAYDLLHGLKTGLKDVIAPQGLFSDLDIKYVGPVDGHDIDALRVALTQARGYRGPVIVHAITRKGHGYTVAENYTVDLFHSVGKIDEATGKPLSPTSGESWTSAFSEAMVELGNRRSDIVAITAAMLHPVGLADFAAAWPNRVLDVGIAEQHAVTCAAGLASAGLHPVVCVYSTFLNRAFDQVIMDVGLHRLGVTFVLDRAGVTGSDGPSHNGVWDVVVASTVPGMRMCAPRDKERLLAALSEATEIDDGPTIVRYSKDTIPPAMPALESLGQVDVIADHPDARVLIVAWGAMCPDAIATAKILATRGVATRVVDPVWALPVCDDLVAMTQSYDLVVTIEDAMVVNGLGVQLRLGMDEAGINVPVTHVGIDHRYLAQASRHEVLVDQGLYPEAMAETINGVMSSRCQGRAS